MSGAHLNTCDSARLSGCGRSQDREGWREFNWDNLTVWRSSEAVVTVVSWDSRISFADICGAVSSVVAPHASARWSRLRSGHTGGLATRRLVGESDIDSACFGSPGTTFVWGSERSVVSGRVSSSHAYSSFFLETLSGRVPYDV